jgi:hypothetical protein
VATNPRLSPRKTRFCLLQKIRVLQYFGNRCSKCLPLPWMHNRWGGGGCCPIIVTTHVHIAERQCNVAHQSSCLFSTPPAEGYRQFESSKSLSFVTVASRIDVDMRFLTRCGVTGLIMRLWRKIAGYPVCFPPKETHSFPDKFPTITGRSKAVKSAKITW